MVVTSSCNSQAITVVALAFDERGDEYDKRARRSADLEAAAAERGDEEATDDGGE
jgi:hypothetical protein